MTHSIDFWNRELSKLDETHHQVVPHDFNVWTHRYYFLQSHNPNYDTDFKYLVDLVADQHLKAYKQSQKKWFGMQNDSNNLNETKRLFQILLRMWAHAEAAVCHSLAPQLQFLLQKALIFDIQPPVVMESNTDKKLKNKKKCSRATARTCFLVDIPCVLGSQLSTVQIAPDARSPTKRKRGSEGKSKPNPSYELVRPDGSCGGWIEHGLTHAHLKKGSDQAKGLPCSYEEPDNDMPFLFRMKNINISKGQDGNLEWHYHIKVTWTFDLSNERKPTQRIECSVLSLPFLVKTSPCEDIKLHHMIFKQYMLTNEEPKFEPISPQTRPTWNEWAQGLDCFYRSLLTRAHPNYRIPPLEQDQLEHLKTRLLEEQERNQQPVYSNPPINSQIAPEATYDKNFISREFFTWFYSIISMIIDRNQDLVKYKYSSDPSDQRSMMYFVVKGFIHPFMSMAKGEQILTEFRDQSIMVIRFSDSKPAHITVLFRRTDGTLTNIQPVSREALASKLTLPGYIHKVFQLRTIDFIYVHETNQPPKLVSKDQLLRGVSKKDSKSREPHGPYKQAPVVALTSNDSWPEAADLIHFSENPLLKQCLEYLKSMERDNRLAETHNQRFFAQSPDFWHPPSSTVAIINPAPMPTIQACFHTPSATNFSAASDPSYISFPGAEQSVNDRAYSSSSLATSAAYVYCDSMQGITGSGDSSNGSTTTPHYVNLQTENMV